MSINGKLDAFIQKEVWVRLFAPLLMVATIVFCRSSTVERSLHREDDASLSQQSADQLHHDGKLQERGETNNDAVRTRYTVRSSSAWRFC